MRSIFFFLILLMVIHAICHASHHIIICPAMPIEFIRCAVAANGDKFAFFFFSRKFPQQFGSIKYCWRVCDVKFQLRMNFNRPLVDRAVHIVDVASIHLAVSSLHISRFEFQQLIFFLLFLSWICAAGRAVLCCSFVPFSWSFESLKSITKFSQML